MMNSVNSFLDYSEFIHFFKTYQARSFHKINADDPFILSLERKLSETGQFFFILDLIQLTGLYYSKGAYRFFGVKNGKIDPALIYESIHPDDIQRFSNARVKLLKLGTQVFKKQINEAYISSNFRVKNKTGQYINLLFQDYVFSEGPSGNKVYAIQVHTNITAMMRNSYGYHYYAGQDVSYFRYPDKDFLSIGNIFTKREWEIINYIVEGLESDQISKKLFVSIHTINRHRQNILKKTGKRTTHDLVIELQANGLI